MKDTLTREVLQQMLPYMNNEQAMRLQSVLGKVLTKYEITEAVKASATESTNEQMVTKFIEAKRIEGCSKKTLAYYRKTMGMRVGEMVLLNRADINFNERECIVLGKGNKERVVYFDARTKIHLKNYLDRLWQCSFFPRQSLYDGTRCCRMC